MKLLMRILLGRRLPITSSRIRVDGLDRPVTIRRDRFGVPHIEAETDADAWFGLGFSQGQDRAFQLELILRVVRGTLAELIGAEGLLSDRLSRRIGFRRHGERMVKALPEDHRHQAEAYAAGVTAGASRGLRRKPHEFVLLRSSPTRYEAADAFGVLAVQAFAIASNWDVELARLKILREDGPEALAALDPDYPEWLPVTSPPGVEAGPAVDRLIDDLASLTAAIEGGGGSNNWALAAERTRTGRPILANDPHLAPTLPPHWYLVHVTAPEWSMAGASFPGIPGIPVGHNGHAAWGVTAGLIDNTDLLIEEVGPDGRSVRRGEGFVECEVLHEVIPVRGADPVEERVLVTPDGPVIGPALEGEIGAVSMAATGLRTRPLGALFEFGRVRSFSELRQVGAVWPALSLNVAYADASGAIGWQLVGDTPLRRKGFGTLPIAARDPEAGWEDEPLPFEQLPRVENPPTGFVATANNRPTTDGAYLGIDFLDGYRVARIVEGLQQRDDWDVPAVLEFQLDQQSIPWREIRDRVLEAAGDTGSEVTRRLLEEWDGAITLDSAAATIFELFVAEMVNRVLAAKAPKAAVWAAGKGFAALVPFNGFLVRRVGHLVRLLRQQPEGWFRDGWAAEMKAAMLVVESRLRAAHGDETANWEWGKIRPLTLKHPMGSRRPLAKVFNLGPFPWGGDANTVSPAPVDPQDPTGNPDFAVAALRMAVDVGGWEHSRFVLPGGQSGNPLSCHYADQLPLWQKGDAIPIAWSKDTVLRSTSKTLRLEPTSLDQK
ncbi:MAG: penicillin acylase family protein [Acidimicrobiia bacterium]